MVYVFFMIISVILKNVHDKKIYLVLMIGIVFGASGLRSSEIGTDTPMYHELFYQITRYGILDMYDGAQKPTEISDVILMHLCTFIFNDSQTYIFLSAMLTGIALYKFIYVNTNDKSYWISFFWLFGSGFYMYSMNVVRESLAIAIACNSVYYLANSQIKKALFLELIATSFHYSLMIFIPLSLIVHFCSKYINNKYKLCLYTVIINLIFWSVVCGFITSLLDFSGLGDVYNSYIQSNYALMMNSTYVLFKMIMYVALVVIAVSVSNDNEIKKVYYFVSFVFAAACCLFIEYNIMFIMYRFVEIFSIYSIIILARITDNIKNRYSRLLIEIGIILVGVINAGFMLHHGMEGVSSYEIFME